MKIVNELIEVLDQEREFLLAGNFKDLESVLDRKLGLIERLEFERSDIPPESHEVILAKAVHNEGLLKAAERGVKSAIHQIKEAALPEAQTTYSQDGARQRLTRQGGSIQQKL